MARRGAPKDDPIMWEVGDESGNEPKGKKKDKSAGLMGKIKQPGSNGSGGLSKRAQKELERREYGNLDTESEEEEDFGAAGARAKKEKSYFSKVKPSHLFIMVIMLGGAIAPMIMMLGSALGPMMSVVTSTVGVPDLQPLIVRLGLAATPKKRLTEFYQKHNPEKIDDVDKLVLKYAGDYKTMTKKLEAKYSDYGFFMGWEKEGGLADTQKKYYTYISKKSYKYYQKYVPFPVRCFCLNPFL